MRIFLAKILLCISIGLLYTHQFVAHHHEDFELASEHHNDFNGSHDEDHLPPHHIAHIFSAEQVKIGVAKVYQQDFFFGHHLDFAISYAEPATLKKEYVEIRPPLLLKGHTTFSLRGPPVV